MSDKSPSQHDQKQQYEALSNEIAGILLGPDSPVRGFAEFDELIADHDRLQTRQAELQALDAKLVEVLPGMEQAEAQLAAVEKQLAAEKKKLAGFAGELGKAAFAGLRAGELPDNPLFADRKALQSRIETLQRQKAELVTGGNAGMMEKAKIQAQQLKLTGQVKVEELKIGSADRALGTALLTSKEKPAIRCDQTEEVLKAIANQRKLVTTAKEKTQHAEATVADRKSAAAATLGRSTLYDADSLKSELKEARKEHRQNEKEIESARKSVVTEALNTETLRENASVGENLKELWSLKFDLESNKSQVSKLADESLSRFKRLPAKIKYAAYGVAGIFFLFMAIMFFKGGEQDGSLPVSEEAIASATEEKRIDANAASGGDLTNTDSVGDMSEVADFVETLVAIKKRGGGVKRGSSDFFVSSNQVIITMDEDTNDDDLRLMRNMTKDLGGLDLGKSQITDAGLTHLQKLKGLKFLLLGGTQVTDTGVASLKGLTQLEALSLTATSVTNKGLVHLGGMSKLKTLDLRGTHITNDGMMHLQRLTNLEYLDLRGSTVSHEGLVGLSGLTKLRNLGVGKSKERMRKGNGLQNILASLSDSVPVASGDFTYKLGLKSYIGTITKESDSQHQNVFPDKSKDRVGVTIDYEEGFVNTTPLGITDGHLHAGSGKENIYIFLHFSVQDRDGIRPVDGKPNYPVRGFVEAIYLTLGPVQQTHFFGKRASEVSSKQQEMLFKARTGLPVIGFGMPSKVETESQRDRILYADFSPAKQFAQFRTHLGKSDLVFSIGNRSFQVDESARKQLFLFERAVAVVRYHKGARDFESRKSLGD